MSNGPLGPAASIVTVWSNHRDRADGNGREHVAVDQSGVAFLSLLDGHRPRDGLSVHVGGVLRMLPTGSNGGGPEGPVAQVVRVVAARMLVRIDLVMVIWGGGDERRDQ